MINRGGAKISAVKIEEIVDALPAIKESAACGVQGTTGLEEIWVAVVAQAPIDVAAIKEYLRNHDAIGTVVDEVIEVPQLPRTALGKVQKNAVKDMLLGLKARG